MVPLRTGFDDTGIMVAPLSPLWWFELMVDIYFSKCNYLGDADIEPVD
jgi:hypothetical protein